MRKIIVLLMLLNFTILSSFATTWVQVGDYEYIDKDSIGYYTNDHGQLQYDKKIYWIKTINHDDLYKDAEKLLNKKVAYCQNQWIIDITKRTSAGKSIIYYDDKGNSLSGYTFKDYELRWDSVVPGSMGEFWFELVRKPKYLKRLYKKQMLI